MPDFLRGSIPRSQHSHPKLGRLVRRRADRLHIGPTWILSHAPQSLTNSHATQQRSCRIRYRSGKLLSRGLRPGHGLWRLRRPQLSMGRPRLRHRGQLQLHEPVFRVRSSNSMSLAIVNPPPAKIRRMAIPTTYNTPRCPGNASLQIKDVVTFRGRAGWATGDFMPYMFGGLAVGRVDVARSATVSYHKFDDYDTSGRRSHCAPNG